MSDSELDRLRKKVENFPSASLLTQLAELTRSQKLYDEAEEWSRRSIRAFPRHGQAYLILAQLQDRAGHGELAVATLVSALEKDPRLISAYRYLADLHARAGRRAEAMAVLSNALAKHNDVGLRQQLADLSAASTATLRARKPGTAAFQRLTVGKIPPPLATMPATPATANQGHSAAPNQAQVATPFALSPTAQPTPPRVVANQALPALASEAGVRGCVVVDASGRVLVARKLEAGADDILAALATEVSRGAEPALAAAGGGALRAWSVSFEQSQVFAYADAHHRLVAVLADPGVRAGMIELRAKAVLAELGTA